MTANKKKILKQILLSLLVIIITGGFIGYKMYNKPHRNVEEATALRVAATKLATDYEINEPEANSQYPGKVLEVSGEISDISKNQKGEQIIMLKGSDMSGIMCTLDTAVHTAIKPGASVVIKGICSGYLTDVVLVRCLVQSK
jgi:uncharacterized protein YpmB